MISGFLSGLSTFCGKKKTNLNVINFLVFFLHGFKANFNVILTIFQRHSHSFSLFFQTKPLRRKNGVGVRREMKKKKKEIEKIGLRVNLYFSL